jgi:FixJ family two-component response regulator
MSVTQPPTIFVVDDDHATREALHNLLGAMNLPVESFSNAQDFLDCYDPNRPGCLVLDVRMPGMSGLELQRELRRKSAEIPVIIITGFGDVQVAVRAMKEGAVDVLEKPFNHDLLLETIQVALKQDARRREESARSADMMARLATLSVRQRQVMDLVISGLLSKQIAGELGISKKTVDAHRAQVMEKLGVASVPQLVEFGVAARRIADSRMRALPRDSDQE